MKAMFDILDRYLSSKQCGSIAEISVPAFNEVDELNEKNEDSLKDQYNMYMGWAMKSVKDKLTLSKMKHKESILLITMEFGHLRHEKSLTVEETCRFSMGNKGGLRIPDLRLRCWACAVLIFTGRFVSVETLSNNVIAIAFNKLCASKQLRQEFDNIYDTFLAGIPNAPEELTLAKPVISQYLYENLLRKLFHSRAAENVNQFKDLYTSRHASKSQQNHLRAALKVVAANKAGSSQKTATKNKNKRKFSEVVPQFITLAAPSMRIDDAAMEEAEAEAEEQEEDSADLDIPEDEDIEWWKSLDDDIDNDIDSQNNENESILCNLASYYNSIVDTVVSTLTR